ncbi:hypothetical protein RhiirB3_454673 [Rhizophagus irregularis]|nr:hypothetical protein RhiirB3_454673 [Rhizophagus irregularis]
MEYADYDIDSVLNDGHRSIIPWHHLHDYANVVINYYFALEALKKYKLTKKVHVSKENAVEFFFHEHE